MRFSTQQLLKYGALVGALMLLALVPMGAQAVANGSAPGEHSPTMSGAVGISAARAMPVDLQSAIDAVEPPPGFSRVSTQVYAMGGDDVAENLTIAEAKFNGSDRSAATVLMIEGGSWNLEHELTVKGERDSQAATVAGRPAALVQGGSSLSLAWCQQSGRIVQIVVRGTLMTPEALLEYAEAIAGGQS